MEPRRLTSLDALRGIAALSIVFWHWQHFFALDGDWQEGWSRDQEPLFWLFKPLYLQGWAAVDLFFVLSGFVFFWLYGEAIREKRVGAWRFALLRLSRLYPLHLVLLILVAAMQYAFWQQNGAFFVYQANDAPHFLAQLFWRRTGIRSARRASTGQAGPCRSSACSTWCSSPRAGSGFGPAGARWCWR